MKHLILFAVGMALAPCACEPTGGDEGGEPTGSLQYFHVPPEPVALAVAADDTVWVACHYGQAVVRLSQSGDLLENWPTASMPDDLVIDADGVVWTGLAGDITGTPGPALVAVETGKGVTRTYALDRDPLDLALDSAGHVWVALGRNTSGNKIDEFDHDGTPMASFQIEGRPRAITVGSDGSIWALVTARSPDQSKDIEEVLKIAPGAGAPQVFPDPCRGSDIAAEADGGIVIYDDHVPALVRLDADGTKVAGYNPGGWNTGAGTEPRGIAIGADGTVWASDQACMEAYAPDLSAVDESHLNGETTSGGSMVPKAIAIDSHGNLWLAIADDWHTHEDVESNTRVGKTSGVAKGPQRHAVTGPVWP